MNVTLSEVKRAAKAHRAPLAGESAGYLVLAIADQVLSAPRLVDATDIQLTEDGALRVLSGRASSEAEAELSLRRALDQLLLVASSGSAALTRASRRTAPIGLSGFVRELEAALIPVNRAAARRALARVQRETSRALASGSLPAEEPESAVMPVQAAPASAPAPLTASTEPLTVSTEALTVSTEPPPPIAESHLNSVLSALRNELLAPPEFQESDALTIALEVRPVSEPSVARMAEAEPELEFDEDVEFEADLEAEAEDSSAAPTVMRAVQVKPVVFATAEAYDEAPSELPAEARTRPEPAVIRRSLRALLPSESLPPPFEAALPRTPALGSLAAQLPVLDAVQLAELALQAEQDLEPTPELTVVTSAPVMELVTELMPEVAPVPPGTAMVASRKSDVSELLNNFHISEHATAGQPKESDEAQLRRAIKEMADLDLTPAPFAALIR